VGAEGGESGRGGYLELRVRVRAMMIVIIRLGQSDSRGWGKDGRVMRTGTYIRIPFQKLQVLLIPSKELGLA
jgi:hypothetical protein